MSLNFYKISKGINFLGQASPPASPANGDMYYDTTLNLFQIYENGAWTGMGGGGGGDMVLASVQTVTGEKTFGTIGGAVGKFILAGSTSGSSILNAAAVAGSTTLTLPGTTGTLALNPMTTGGDLIYGGTSGVETRLPNGSAGQVLQSNGTTLAPTWVIPAVPSALNDMVSADDLGAMTFKASMFDTFADVSASVNTTVDYGTNKTDATLLSTDNKYIRLNYDASKTVAASTTTTNLNISAVAAFTVKIGDFAIYGSEVKRITAVASQSSFTTEAFSVAPTLAGQITISQGVYTKDLNAFAGDGLAPSTAFSTTINQVLVNYEETAAVNDIIFDANTAPIIGFSVSSDGTTYSALTARPTNLSDSVSLLNLPTSGTNLYIRFVANKSSGSGLLNLLNYKVFFHRDLSYLDGSVLNQAYCFTDGTGTEINCLTPSVVVGKTRIQVTGFTYPVAVNSGYTNESLKVYLNGSKIPRFVDSTITPDAYYKEIDQRTIELDADYSAMNLSLELIQDVAVIDNIDVNTSNISYLQEVQQQGFQAFVNDNARLSATTTAGTPAVGTFYSSITNRASIPDLTANLRAHIGIERIMVQQIQQLQNEFGASGEPVWSALNDDKNQIRYVGSWASLQSSNGPYVNTVTVNDYLEITFYGTGLNILSYYDVSAPIDFRASIDGATEIATNLYGGTKSNVLTGRNYAMNGIFPVSTGLSLGVHTIKIRNNNAIGMYFFGFEILNESSTIKLNPGSSYANGKKLTLNSQQSLAYNSSFESGTLGTRGGRVIVYQKADSTLAKAVQPTDAAQANLTSASHTNEEMLRQYNFREFGAGRTDDFSTLTTTAGSKTFTLDDGTTNLVGNDVNVATGFEADIRFNSASSYITLTFIGTGLDIIGSTGGGSVASVSIDGASSVGNIVRGTSGGENIKVVSGLPYGTHIIKFLNVAGGAALFCRAFRVYGPKKPTLPSGAVELADYNVMATYVAMTGDFSTRLMSTGVLTKHVSREIVATGAWTASLDAGIPSGFSLLSTVIGNYIEYNFFGTGIEASAFQTAFGHIMTIQIDGVAYTGAATPTTGSTWTPGTSTWAITSGTYCTLQITGLTLGMHKIRVNNNENATSLYLAKFDIITPIHSPKSNQYADLQNTLSVGSCTLSDNRQITPIKNALPATKAWSQAVGVASDPTTTSTGAIPMPDMSCSIKTSGGPIEVSYSAVVQNAGANFSTFTRIYVNGIAIGVEKRTQFPTAGGYRSSQSDSMIVPVSAGTHKVDVYWWVDGSTGTGNLIDRNLTVKEI